MADLTTWLLEQIAEDEAVARAAEPEDGVWYAPGESHLDTDAEEQLFLRFNPARVLAECEAKRRIVELHRPFDDLPVGSESSWEEEPRCQEDGKWDWPCATLRLLALPYADRPGFREEWRLATRAGADA